MCLSEVRMPDLQFVDESNNNSYIAIDELMITVGHIAENS